jgi:hypothetical protein
VSECLEADNAIGPGKKLSMLDRADSPRIRKAPAAAVGSRRKRPACRYGAKGQRIGRTSEHNSNKNPEGKVEREKEDGTVSCPPLSER